MTELSKPNKTTYAKKVGMSKSLSPTSVKIVFNLAALTAWFWKTNIMVINLWALPQKPMKLKEIMSTICRTSENKSKDLRIIRHHSRNLRLSVRPKWPSFLHNKKHFLQSKRNLLRREFKNQQKDTRISYHKNKWR